MPQGETVRQILEAHPRLNFEGIQAALAFAAEVLRSDVVYPADEAMRILADEGVDRQIVSSCGRLATLSGMWRSLSRRPVDLLLSQANQDSACCSQQTGFWRARFPSAAAFLRDYSYQVTWFIT